MLWYKQEGSKKNKDHIQIDSAQDMVERSWWSLDYNPWMSWSVNLIFIPETHRESLGAGKTWVVGLYPDGKCNITSSNHLAPTKQIGCMVGPLWKESCIIWFICFGDKIRLRLFLLQKKRSSFIKGAMCRGKKNLDVWFVFEHQHMMGEVRKQPACTFPVHRPPPSGSVFLLRCQ